MHYKRITFTIIFIVLASVSLYGFVPQLINYQGRLTDNSGTPVPDGDYEITFSLYGEEVGGDVYWSETHPAVPVTDGLFSVLLGSIWPFDSASGTPPDSFIWAGITIGSDPELTPRSLLSSVAFAFNAKKSIYADTAYYIASSEIINSLDAEDGDPTEAVFVDSEGKVGIGTTTPTSQLHVAAQGDTTGGIPPYHEVVGLFQQTDPVDHAAVSIQSMPGRDAILYFAEGDTANWSIRQDVSNSYKLQFHHFDNSSAKLNMTIDTSGKVGIGTNNPLANLDVRGYMNLGSFNTITTNLGFIVGNGNAGNGDYVALLGGYNNDITGNNSFIGNGVNNLLTGDYSIIASGYYNSADGNYTTVSGGRSNEVHSAFSAISGGSYNKAYGPANAVSGGTSNESDSAYSSIGGGALNISKAPYATVAGGNQNDVSGHYGAIGGGNNNLVGDYYGVVAGGSNNDATGYASAILGGTNNIASAGASTAMGRFARARHNGSVVINATYPGSISDSISSGGAGQIVLCAKDGMYITDAPGIAAFNTARLINTNTGAYLGNDGVWYDNSNAESKENFSEIDRHSLLEKISQLPITSWNYKNDENKATHIGPTAQDFNAVFELGNNEKAIATIDEAGISLAAIQQLILENKLLKEQLLKLSERLSKLEEK